MSFLFLQLFKIQVYRHIIINYGPYQSNYFINIGPSFLTIFKVRLNNQNSSRV